MAEVSQVFKYSPTYSCQLLQLCVYLDFIQDSTTYSI